MIKVKRLEQHVAEFREADAHFAIFHAGANTFLGDHHVHGEVLADIPQKIEEAHAGGPGSVVYESRGILLHVEIKEWAHLFFDARDVVIEGLAREKLSLGAFAAGI